MSMNSAPTSVPIVAIITDTPLPTVPIASFVSGEIPRPVQYGKRTPTITTTPKSTSLRVVYIIEIESSEGSTPITRTRAILEPLIGGSIVTPETTVPRPVSILVPSRNATATLSRISGWNLASKNSTDGCVGYGESAPINDGPAEESYGHEHHPHHTPAFYFVVIGLPGLLVVGVVMGFLWRRWRKRRKDKRLATAVEKGRVLCVREVTVMAERITGKKDEDEEFGRSIMGGING